MDDTRFETWLRALEDSISRRGILGILGGAGLAAAPALAGAKRGKRRGRRGTSARGADKVSAASKSAPSAGGRYRTLAAKWWVWAIDEEFGPIIESGSVDCAAGQQGKTWFLAGSFFNIGPVSRECSIPAGTKLFFPVVNAFAAAPPGQTACTLVPEPTPRQKQEHQACAASLIDPFDPADLTATVDGEPVPIVRADSALFPFHLDDPNIFGVPGGTYLETADGYWVLLDPLPPGEHTIRFAADPVLDVTYEITIV